MKEIALKIATTGLKTLGFGLAYNGLQDELLGDDAHLYNYIAVAVGSFSWLLGICLERRAAAVNEVHSTKKSTAIITQCLSHLGGAGLVSSIAHLVKHNGSVLSSANLIAEALTAPAAIEEFKSSISYAPKLKWEKSRFLFTLAADYLAVSAGLKMLNGETPSTFTFVSLGLGVGMQLAELVYTIKYDRPELPLKHALNRRGIKMCVGIGTIFTVLDIVDDLQDRYLIADDALTLVINLFLFAALVEMRRIANAQTALETNLLDANEEVADDTIVVNIADTKACRLG